MFKYFIIAGLIASVIIGTFTTLYNCMDRTSVYDQPIVNAAAAPTPAQTAPTPTPQSSDVLGVDESHYSAP